jgi:hypothetical protein
MKTFLKVLKNMNKEIPEKKNRSKFSKISFSRHSGCNGQKNLSTNVYLFCNVGNFN